MKLINLLLLFLPVLGYSQVDTSNMSNVGIRVDSLVFGDNLFVGEKLYIKERPKPTLYKLKPDTLFSGGITTQNLDYYQGSSWYSYPKYSTVTKKGVAKASVQVMDSGIKVEVFETRDTLYKCPVSHIQYFDASGQQETFTSCTLDKVVTCRTYRFYIINEEGKKEYLELDISKNK